MFNASNSNLDWSRGHGGTDWVREVQKVCYTIDAMGDVCGMEFGNN